MPAKFRVEITASAEKDLDGIWGHIAGNSVDNAERFVLELEERIGTLERMPLRCPAISENELLGSEYRHLIVRDYRVIFSIRSSKVFVLRIVHGNKLLDSVEKCGAPHFSTNVKLSVMWS